MTTLTTTLYERKDRETLLNLMFYSRRAHTHLDWYRPAMWLDVPGVHVRMAWMRDELAGFMGISTPIAGTAWIRLVALQNQQAAAPILQALWDDILPDLRADGIEQVNILVVNRWVQDFLTRLSFEYQEDVVTLYRNSTALPTLPAKGLTLRESYLEDVPGILEVDHAAFVAPWRMHTDELRQAVRYAASNTVALLDHQVVGYQISTRHHTSGHLARLGVRPDLQGKGIGAALLDELLSRFLKRGVRTMTVNTQESNFQSLRLYGRYEFQRNGFDLPVWVAKI